MRRLLSGSREWLPRLPSFSRIDIRWSRLSRFWTALNATTGMASRVAFYLGIAMILGIGSSWYMIEIGSRVSVRSEGPWMQWASAGRASADPYTRARFARQGSLPLPSDLARSYESRRDDDGQRLHSSCDYLIEGEGLDNAWWSFAAFDERGQLIPNAADRYAYNNKSIARAADGSFIITLSRDARPGNWLPTSGAGRLTLMFSIIPSQSQAADSSEVRARQLPGIRRLACR